MRVSAKVLKKINFNTETDSVKIRPLPKPQAGKQQAFYDSEADIVIYGGSAGSGKTIAVLLDAAKPEYLKDPDYRAVIFRRTYPEIKNPGGILDESQKYYFGIQGSLTLNPLDWTFPSEAKIAFRHIQYEKTVYEYQGSQIGSIYFDELTHFSEEMFFYMLSRNRTNSTISSKIRATCNPDADSWVAKFISWYIGDDGYPIEERGGIIRWFIRIQGEIEWADSKQELLDKYPKSKPKSFTFIPALITDNPILLKKDPSYMANLEALHPVERARLLKGNWKVKYEEGTIFNRFWFEIVDSIPDHQDLEARFWDLASTSKDMAKSTHYYSAGCKGVKIGDIYYILDLIAEQKSPGELEDLIVSTSQQDGKNTLVRWELEGGSAGALYENQLTKALQENIKGVNAKAIKPMGDKVTRAIPTANAAHQGKIKLLRGAWNNTFLSSVNSFDGTKKPLVNDIVDALDGLYSVLDKPVVVISSSSITRSPRR